MVLTLRILQARPGPEVETLKFFSYGATVGYSLVSLVYVYLYAYIHIHVNMHICICLCICKYIYMCIYV